MTNQETPEATFNRCCRIVRRLAYTVVVAHVALSTVAPQHIPPSPFQQDLTKAIVGKLAS